MQIARQSSIFSISVRRLHVSPLPSFPRKTQSKVVVGLPPPPELAKTGMLFDDDQEDGPDVDGGTSGVHLMLQQQREVLNYMRLIEHDMPKLVRWRKPFSPPTDETPLIVRTISYGGEDHPATAKRAIVVPITKLPLKSPQAIRNCKLLSGTRWSPSPPRDSGFSEDKDGDAHGYIKISCDDFPEPGMNLKWASDVLDRLVAESNMPNPKFTDLPQDTRHIDAKARKAKKGEHYRGRAGRPTIRDFPTEWLPRTPLEESDTASHE